MRDKLKKIADLATEAARSAAEQIASTRAGVKLVEVANSAHKGYHNSGLAEQVDSFTNNVSEHFDTVSGAKILALVEERLAVQAQYNDILATKLEEALRRISDLEKKD